MRRVMNPDIRPLIDVKAGNYAYRFRCAYDIAQAYMEAKREQILLDSYQASMPENVRNAHPESENDFIEREALKKDIFLKPEAEWECMDTNLEALLRLTIDAELFEEAALIRDTLHDLHMHEAGIAVKKMLKKMHIPTMPEPTQTYHPR